MYPLLLSEKAFIAEQCAVSSLTEYEIGNTLWKESKGKRIDYTSAAHTFSEALSELKKIGINGMDDVLKIAMERNLTFYDASYACIAEKEGLLLVTEDMELLKKCKCAIRTKEIEGI